MFNHKFLLNKFLNQKMKSSLKLKFLDTKKDFYERNLLNKFIIP